MLAALFLILAFLSEVVGTIAGFGSSVFFVPLAGFFFGFHEVLALTSILHVFSNAAKMVLFGRHIRWRLLFLLGIPSLIFVMVGAFLSARLEFRFTELILGLFLVGFSILFFLRPALRLSPNPSNSIVFGGAAGFLAGLIGTGGALRGLVLAAFDLEKKFLCCYLGRHRYRRRSESHGHLSGVRLSATRIILDRTGVASGRVQWLLSGESPFKQD